MKINLKYLEVVWLLVFFIVGCFYRTTLVANILITTIIMYALRVLLSQAFELKIVIIFIIMYMSTFYQYFFWGNQISYYTQFNSYSNLYETMLICYLFNGFFIYTLSKLKCEKIEIIIKDNVLIYFLSFVICVFLFLNGVNGEIGNYKNIELSTSAEYSIIFFLLAFYYSGNSFIKRTSLTIIYLFFGIYALLIGSRIVSIQYMMAIFLVSDWKIFSIIRKKSANIKGNLNIIYILLAMLLMKGIGAIRSSGLSIQKLLVAMFSTSNQTGVVINNQSDVIYSTVSLIALESQGVIDFKVKVLSFIQHIAGLFLPGSLNGEYSNFPAFVVKNSINYGGGGGFFFGPIYIWFGYIGVILIAVFLGKSMTIAYTGRCSTIFKFYVLILIITLFRWYPYTIYGIYKLPLYGVIMYYIANLVDRTMRKK